MALLLAISVALASCTTTAGGTDTATQAVETTAASSVPSPAQTPTATAIPVPMAMTINGVGIPQAEYDAQRIQLLAAIESSGQTLSEEEVQAAVQEYFIESELLAQAAYAEGYSLSEDDLSSRISARVQDAGGEEAFNAWLQTNGFTAESFRSFYARELAAAWMRDSIAASIGETAEQVHARQILVNDKDTADQIYRQLQGGSDFATMAEEYDTLTKGELGWFPRGYLFLPEIEDAVFALQPGGYTGVIQSQYGYQIVQMIEKADRPLSNEAHRSLAHQAMQNWLDTQRAQVNIEILTQ